MKKLEQLLTSCESLLRGIGEYFWADKIKTVLKKIENGDIASYVFEEIQSWFGGMGSFNDLVISRYNDHLIDEKDEQRLNDHLNKLRREIYDEVIRLKATS